jgi:hypothetical protein
MGKPTWVDLRLRPSSSDNRQSSPMPRKHPICFCNIQIKPLQHTSKTDEIFLKKQMKYLKHTVETPLQQVQHPDLLLKHPEATLATYKKKADETHETCI